MKKLIALLLALVMVIGLVACGNTPAADETKAPAADETKAPAADETEAPAKDPVTITYRYTQFVGEQEYTDDVEAKLNEIMQAIPGYEHISIDLIPTADHATEVTLAQANGDQIDLVSTFDLEFEAMVANGDFLALDDLLAQYPGVLSDIPEWLIDYGKIDGTTYYVPTYQQAQSPAFFYAPVAYFDYYYAASGNDEAAVREILQHGTMEEKLDFFEAFYQAVVAGTGKTTKKMVNCHYPYHYYNKEDLVASNGKVVLLEGADEPVYWTMTEEFELTQRRANEWFKNGWVNTPDVKNSYNFMTDDNSVVYGVGTNAMSEEAYGKALSNENKGTIKAIRMIDHSYIESRWAAGGNAIYTDCEHPEEAMMIIELLMSEKGKEFYNTLIWGLEGIHWEWVDEEIGRIKTLEFEGAQGGAETTYCTWNWNTGNVFNGYMNQSMANDDHYAYIENEIHNGADTVVSPFMGYTWHLEDISDQLGQLNAVESEFFGTLYAAEDFDATYADYMAKLEAAGVNEVMDFFKAEVKKVIG